MSWVLSSTPLASVLLSLIPDNCRDFGCPRHGSIVSLQPASARVPGRASPDPPSASSASDVCATSPATDGSQLKAGASSPCHNHAVCTLQGLLAARADADEGTKRWGRNAGAHLTDEETLSRGRTEGSAGVASAEDGSQGFFALGSGPPSCDPHYFHGV